MLFSLSPACFHHSRLAATEAPLTCESGHVTPLFNAFTTYLTENNMQNTYKGL